MKINLKIFALLVMLVLTQVLGDIWLSRGMKVFGSANPLNWQGLGTLVLYLWTSPWILLGVGTLIVSLLLYYVSVSRMDLSFVLPIHASSYVMNALLAWLILHERVSVIRWISALTITIGVLIVSITETQMGKKMLNKRLKTLEHWQKVWFNRFFFFLLPISFSIPKTWLAILIVAFADGFGDIFNATGMKRIGPVSIKSFPQMLEVGHKIVTNRWILQGITCQTVAFLGFVSALSWADISFVRPATALTYIISLLGARFILKERIELGRLAGIIIVGIGIILISLDEQAMI